MPHVPILSQMRGRRGLAAGRDHLVQRATLNELRIKLLTELTPPAGARVKTFHYLSINMFHEAFSWEMKVAGSCCKVMVP
jgi:hypothetical protein